MSKSRPEKPSRHENAYNLIVRAVCAMTILLTDHGRQIRQAEFLRKQDPKLN